MRRTPLTDLLAARNKLSALKLSTLKLGGAGRRGKTLAYGGTALALAGIGGVTAAAADHLGHPGRGRDREQLASPHRGR